MRTTFFLRTTALALALAAPLATVAYAGDHAGNQWRSDADMHRSSTTYDPSNPALVQLEQRTYHDDMARQGVDVPMTADAGPSSTVIIVQ